MELVDLLEMVEDRKSFSEFVDALIQDKLTKTEEWENMPVEIFLDGANRWLEASGKEELSWKLMAEFLYCGKIYD